MSWDVDNNGKAVFHEEPDPVPEDHVICNCGEYVHFNDVVKCVHCKTKGCHHCMNYIDEEFECEECP